MAIEIVDFPQKNRESPHFPYPLVNVNKKLWKIHNVLWENPLFLWPCSIAMLNYQRVCLVILFDINLVDYVVYYELCIIVCYSFECMCIHTNI